jgi:hypothetical protein
MRATIRTKNDFDDVNKLENLKKPGNPYSFNRRERKRTKGEFDEN